MTSTKNGTIVLCLIIVLLICGTQCGNWLQHGLLCIGLLLFNIYCFFKMKIDNKAILLCGELLTLLFIVFTFYQFYNAVSFGFLDGLCQGIFENATYNDTYNYFYESVALAQIMDNSLYLWLQGQINMFGFYGPYNPYNIFNAILILLFNADVISLILLKLYVVIAAVYFLYDIAVRFLSPFWSCVAVLLYNLYPGYLLCSTSLLRDNLVAFLIIFAVNMYLNIKEYKRGTILYKVLLLSGLVVLFFFRSYAAAFVLVTLLFYNINKHNMKSTIVYFFIVVIAFYFIVIYCFGIERLNINFLEYDYNSRYNQKITTPVELLIYSVYYIVFASMSSWQNLTLGLYSSVLNFIAPLYLNICLLSSTVAAIYCNFKKNVFCSMKFLNNTTLLMPLLFSFLITFVYAGILPRLYIQWLWANAILICIFYSSIKMRVRIICMLSSIIFVGVIYVAKYFFA